MYILYLKKSLWGGGVGGFMTNIWNMQKKIWNIINLHQNLKNWNFVSSEGYSKNQIDNPIYYVLLVIFQKPKIIV